jgi:cyanophycinase
MRLMPVIVLIAMMSCGTDRSHADERQVSLIIEGGGLPPYCPALERLVEAATTNGRLRIGFLPTAGYRPDVSAQHFVDRLKSYGVRPDQVQKIDITEKNAAVQAENPEVVRQIRECTAIFFGGGDQTRITRALRRQDGSSTPALDAIYDTWRQGAIIAGTSAGAAVQSETMITVSGVPDDSIDEGLDVLDFGLTKAAEQPERRGLLISQGLGFLKAGIIDQHFTQYRGRLGRLSRATTEERVRYGFGIDEDAALVVDREGNFEVLGPGQVTIVDSANATCQDGPLGCSILGIQVTMLGHGDQFDPKTGTAIIHPSKKKIVKGKESNNGNFLIPDIAGRGAVPFALIAGLGNNTSRKQVGISLKYNRHYGHGYRYTFSKTDQTQGYEATVNGLDIEAVTNIRLNIEPVSLNLRSPESSLPVDLPEGPVNEALRAICYRGIMSPDDDGLFRPQAAITRSELANAIAQTIRLEFPRRESPAISDLPSDSAEADDILLIVSAGLMETTTVDGQFRPLDSITHQEAAAILVRLAERYQSRTLESEPYEVKDADEIDARYRPSVFAAIRAKLLVPDQERIRPEARLTRSEAASALFEIIGFPWRK